MSIQQINVGTSPSGTGGDNFRDASEKINQNFQELSDALNQMADGTALSEHAGNTNNPHSVTKSHVGLGNVDNTSDVDKPISTATQQALNGHAGNTNNPHSVNKAQVGLGNVDNTSDVDKPVSTATQTALNLKANNADLAAIAKTGSFSDLNNVPDATTAQKGIIQLATATEAQALENATKALTSATFKDAAKAFFNANGNAPMYLCRAWVNFNAIPLSGTYSQVGTTVTVTMTAHGMSVGQAVNLSVTSGTAISGSFIVTSVADANTFTYTAATSLTTSGNITRNLFIRGSGNVLGVTDNGVGNYTVSFITAMPDANYCWSGSVQGDATGYARSAFSNTADVNTTTILPVKTGYSSSGSTALVDFSTVSISVFR